VLGGGLRDGLTGWYRLPMGLFDLRCALSGLSLSGAMNPQRFRSAIVLLEDVGGRFAPIFPPVGGHYDRYGRIELWGDDDAQAAHAAWAGAALMLLWEAGILRTNAPSSLARLIDGGDFGDGAGPLLAHIAETAYRGHEVRIDGTLVLSCLYREDVAAEIEADTSPDLLAAEPPRLPLLDAFRPLPPETVDVLARFGRVLRWADRHGGLRPIDLSGAHQHHAEHFDRFSREAYRRDPVLRRLLSRWHRKDMEALDARRQVESPPVEPPAAPFEPAMVARVLDARGVPRDERETLVAAISAATDRDRVVRLLSATPPPIRAVLAEFDGVIGRKKDLFALHNAAFPENPVRYKLTDLEVLVREGDTVMAGQPLTAGEAALDDELRILGASAVVRKMSAELGALLGVSPERARGLLEPMLEHVRIRETGERLSGARWSEWISERGPSMSLRADPVLTGYPRLVQHVDPTLDEIDAAQARWNELLERLEEDPTRYYLPRDLVDQAPA